MPATLNLQNWPLLAVILEGRDDDASIHAMLRGLTDTLARGGCAVLFDTSGVEYPSFAEAQRWAVLEAVWIGQQRELIKQNVVGVAFVITNPAVRFLLSTIMSMAPFPTFHTVCGSRDEGIAWCSQKIRDSRLRSLPPRP